MRGNKIIPSPACPEERSVSKEWEGIKGRGIRIYNLKSTILVLTTDTDTKICLSAVAISVGGLIIPTEWNKINQADEKRLR